MSRRKLRILHVTALSLMVTPTVFLWMQPPEWAVWLMVIGTWTGLILRTAIDGALDRSKA
jgi:hypothetical protein